MTIDEAIEIYERRANTHEREAEYHRPLGYSHEAVANVAEMQAREERQIAKWLKELKERRADRKTEPLTCRNKEFYKTCEYSDNCNQSVCRKAFDEFSRMLDEATGADEPQTCNDCDFERCETCVTEIGKDEPQTDCSWK